VARLFIRQWLIAVLALPLAIGCSSSQKKPPALVPPGAVRTGQNNPARSPYPPRLSSGNQQPTAVEGLHAAVANNPVAEAVGGATRRVGNWFKPNPHVADANDPTSLASGLKQPNVDLYLAAAHVYERGDNPAGAIHQYHRALKTEPHHLQALLGIAHVYDRQGKTEQATKFYHQAVEHHPESAAAHNDLGLCHARSGRFEQSAASLARAVELAPEKKLYANNIAKVLVELGRTDEALKYLARVHPPAVAHYNLGYVLQSRGRGEEAARHFARALQIDPGMQEAKAWLARLSFRPVAYHEPLQEEPPAAQVRVSSEDPIALEALARSNKSVRGDSRLRSFRAKRNAENDAENEAAPQRAAPEAPEPSLLSRQAETQAEPPELAAAGANTPLEFLPFRGKIREGSSEVALGPASAVRERTAPLNLADPRFPELQAIPSEAEEAPLPPEP